MDGETELTRRIIGCAVEVHRRLGPGLLEGVYESALCIELRTQGVSYSGRSESLCTTVAS